MVVHRCIKCNKTFDTGNHLRRHLARKTPCVYPCPTCGKKYTKTKGLKEHKCPALKVTATNNVENRDSVPIQQIQNNNTTINNNNTTINNNNTTIHIHQHVYYDTKPQRRNFGEEISLPTEEIIYTICSNPNEKIYAELDTKLRTSPNLPENHGIIEVRNLKSNYIWVHQNGEHVPMHINNVNKIIVKKHNEDMMTAIKECSDDDIRADPRIMKVKKLIENVNRTEPMTKIYEDYVRENMEKFDEEEQINIKAHFKNHLERAKRMENEQAMIMKNIGISLRENYYIPKVYKNTDTKQIEGDQEYTAEV